MSLASLSMLLMSANSPSGWPGMISNFVMFVQVPLLSWSGLRLPLFFCRFRSSHRKHYFARQWCANGVVGSVRAGHLVLSI